MWGKRWCLLKELNVISKQSFSIRLQKIKLFSDINKGKNTIYSVCLSPSNYNKNTYKFIKCTKY